MYIYNKMDLTTIIAILLVFTIFGGATGVIASQVLYVIILIAVVLFVLKALNVVI